MKTATHTPGPWAIQITGGKKEVVTGSVKGLWATIEGPDFQTRNANARLIAAAPDLLDALRRLAHPSADDSDLSHALDVIARATGAIVTPLNSPQARALEAWILENDLRNQRGPLGDAIMSAWLENADSGQGIVEIPARWSVTGAPVTFNVWEAAL